MTIGDIEKLRSTALLFWPENIIQSIERGSLPLLLQTQDSFLDVLSVSTKHPQSWLEVLRNNDQLYLNLFLKHLMVFADIGGEKIQRFKQGFNSIFPDGRFAYWWRGRSYNYVFNHETPKWSNDALKVSEKKIHTQINESTHIVDLANLLLFAGLSIDTTNIPEVILEKCTVGLLIGEREKIETEAKEKYMYVSGITSGATFNALGHAAQTYVEEFIRRELGTKWSIEPSIPGISQNDGRTPMNFDAVFRSPTGKYTAIEVSFQVTTNSVIERKAGQAEYRRELLHQNGHNITYVIDGSGNFQRTSALTTIMDNSDCTVSMSDQGLQQLSQFIKAN